ncbi:MAG TPA: ComEC/Rec2 family competence protein, partial [Thermogutta sp.]|nr:ComEC/Rec2 family competence protein [Thermogutta sp.]
VGPQLSFLAASVLLVVQSARLRPSDPFLTSPLGQPSAWVRFFRSLRQRVMGLLVLSVTVWLIILPLVVHQFHIVNPLSVILTPILVFPITVALLTGFLLILLGPVLGPLAAFLAWLCHTSLSITESVIVSTCQNLPLYWWLPSPPGAWVMGFYVLWLVFLIWGYRGPRWLARPLQVGLSVWLLCGALFLAWPRKASPHEFRFTLLSVGHGLASVLELPNGEVWVYDVGSFGNHRRPARVLAGYLWSRGYRRIDTVILSHADLDHFNGLPLLVDYFSVKKIVVSPQMFCRSEPALEELRRLVTTSRIPCETVRSGRFWDSRGCRLEIIHPPLGFSAPDDNAHSLVVVVDYAGRRILLPGDLEGQGTRTMLSTPQLTVDALVAPHHGSVRGQAGDLVRWCRPRWLLVSGGQSSLESVKEHFQGQVEEILHTAETGAITLVFSAQGCEVIVWNTP